ncbi:hypothetical protein HX126_17490 [Chryseobacterium indologenes]|uniref:hypothetical protein n=1 Tax=Chryseobacterium indologenes TaxID=253 RepID=UPI002577D126|nr:hypothetical protein [Chryseobacterium indologenes]MDM1556348.1 hypothetical protein [Chryseobacterium indologenes]
MTKLSRKGLKIIQGSAVFVTCTLPNGQPTTRCREKCPQEFCAPTNYICLIPMNLCGHGI